jgi:hypothetical protein
MFGQRWLLLSQPPRVAMTASFLQANAPPTKRKIALGHAYLLDKTRCFPIREVEERELRAGGARLHRARYCQAKVSTLLLKAANDNIKWFPSFFSKPGMAALAIVVHPTAEGLDLSFPCAWHGALAD